MKEKADVQPVIMMMFIMFLGIGGALCFSHKTMALKLYFHLFDFFSETASRWHIILCHHIA